MRTQELASYKYVEHWQRGCQLYCWAHKMLLEPAKYVSIPGGCWQAAQMGWAEIRVQSLAAVHYQKEHKHAPQLLQPVPPAAEHTGRRHD